MQGKPKLPSKPAKRQAAPAAPKKGRRRAPPKKPALIQDAARRKALTAKVTHSIEQQMVAAASAGKLTIMKPDPAA